LFDAGAMRTVPDAPGESHSWLPPEPTWPPSVPLDYVQTFNYDVVQRYGEAVRPLLVHGLTGKEAGQITSTLGKYSHEQLRAMIRVLVYDWEAICELWWPYPRERYPLFRYLITLADRLCGAITAGIDGGTNSRGRHDSYARTFLKQAPAAEERNLPF
jgi:hypothetical protein